MPRPPALLASLFLFALLSLPAAPARAQSAPSSPAALPHAFAGFELVEASYLLRAPDGSLVRVTRPGPGVSAADTPWAVTPEGVGPARAQPVIGLQGLISRWLWRSPQAVDGIGAAVREMWTQILRLLDYLGVVVLLTASWGVWFLARPMLPGVPDRTAFLFIFALAAGLWAYVTELYTSIAYALGLLLLPALAAATLAFLGRRLLALFRRPEPTAP